MYNPRESGENRLISKYAQIQFFMLRNSWKTRIDLLYTYQASGPRHTLRIKGFAPSMIYIPMRPMILSLVTCSTSCRHILGKPSVVSSRVNSSSSHWGRLKAWNVTVAPEILPRWAFWFVQETQTGSVFLCTKSCISAPHLLRLQFVAHFALCLRSPLCLLNGLCQLPITWTQLIVAHFMYHRMTLVTLAGTFSVPGLHCKNGQSKKWAE